MGGIMAQLGDILALIVAALMLGVVLNSKNTVGLINALGNAFSGSLRTVAGTIR